MSRPGARRALTLLALLLVGVVLVLPLAAILTGALREGPVVWWRALRDPDTLAALALTLRVLVWVVPLNVVLGVTAAWALARGRVPGRRWVLALLDAPFAVSPVVAGMLFALLFGAGGWFGPWLREHGIAILFAPPGIILATLFVTTPFVAREVLPLLEADGHDEEEAARLLGANGWQVFRRVTLPNIRLGVWYGAVLTAARALGEFGAVSVVSGHIRGVTNTVPLHVEVLYNEYRRTDAFAVASLLAGLALLTLLAQWGLERRAAREAT